MTKNGAPSNDASGSHHSTSGTGAVDNVATSRIASNCPARSYDGKTGTSPGCGATRATSASSCVSPSPPCHDARNSTVSLDIPLASVPATSLTTAATPSREPSHDCNTDRSTPG